MTVWTDYTDDLTTDEWMVHETLAEARKHYGQLLEADDLHSASICAVVESTDYPKHPALTW